MDAASRSPGQLQLGLRLGTQSVSDVVDWADEQIASAITPSNDLIDLAMMRNANPIDVDGKLGELAGDFDKFDLLPAVLAEAHSQLLADPSFGPVLARGLYSMYVDCGYEVPDAFLEIAGFDDEYALAKQGTYGTEGDAYKRLLHFTGRFRCAA